MQVPSFVHLDETKITINLALIAWVDFDARNHDGEPRTRISFLADNFVDVTDEGDIAEIDAALAHWGWEGGA